MRVVIDGRPIQDHFPGIGRYVYNLVRALAGLEDAPSIDLIYDPVHPSTRFDLERLTIGAPSVCLVPLPLTPFDPRSQIVAPLLLRRLKADVYHSPYYIMPYAAGRRVVVTLYDTIPLIYPEFLPYRPARWLYRLATNLAGRRAAAILAISRCAADDLTRVASLPATRITVTPLAADPQFRPLPNQAEVAHWRALAGLPARYVLYVGINKPHKNLERLVRAWAIVYRQWRPSWGSRPALVLAGREDRRYPAARRAAEELGPRVDIRFLGDVWDSDLPWLYNGATVFVFPSLYEGFGLPVLEAMACGTPVACSNRSSMPEIVGPAGRLFDPLNEEEIAAALVALLGDSAERERRSALGLKQAGQFSWHRTAALTLAVYRKAAASKRSA